MEKTICSVCSLKSKESKLLLFYLKRKMISMQQQKSYVPSLPQNEFDTSDSFSRLLRIVFGERMTSNSVFARCSHSKYSKWLIKCLRCSKQDFEEICEKLLRSLAERNYNLAVLEDQMKNIADKSWEIVTGKYQKKQSQRKVRVRRGKPDESHFSQEEMMENLQNAQQLQQPEKMNIPTFSTIINPISATSLGNQQYFPHMLPIMPFNFINYQITSNYQSQNRENQ